MFPHVSPAGFQHPRLSVRFHAAYSSPSAPLFTSILLCRHYTHPRRAVSRGGAALKIAGVPADTSTSMAPHRAALFCTKGTYRHDDRLFYPTAHFGAAAFHAVSPVRRSACGRGRHAACRLVRSERHGVAVGRAHRSPVLLYQHGLRPPRRLASARNGRRPLAAVSITEREKARPAPAGRAFHRA